jgi:TonB dependent receptor
MMRRALVLQLAVLIVLVVCAQIVAANDIQEKSSIIGTFTGGKIASEGVTVRLVDSILLHEVARTVTDKDGKFMMPNLLPGLYLITVDAGSMKNMFKRVEVVSGSPTFIDIRPLLSEQELKEHNGWERFKWTIKMAERNPLRDEVGVTAIDNEAPESDGLLAALRSFQQANGIEGEVSYLSVGSGRQDILTHQMAQVAVQGRLEDTGSWSFNGNYLDGLRSSYLARGGVQYELFNHDLDVRFSANDLIFAEYPELLSRQRIARFVQSADSSTEEDSRWITNISVDDYWPIQDRIQIEYGVRVDYYGYLQDTVHYSPHLGASIDLAPGITVHGTFFRNASAPGNLAPESDGFHSYVHEIAFVPYGTTLNPEIAQGFESGVDVAGDDYHLAVVYTYQNVEDKVATVDVRNTPVSLQLQSLRPFVIFNATSQESHGVEAEFEKRLSHFLTARASYNITQTIPIYIVEKGAFSEGQMYFRLGEKSEDYHDVQAGIRADIQQTNTRVAANWKWSSGSPLIFGRNASGALSALDLEVYQGIPFQVFSETDLKLLVAVQNILDREQASTGNADYYRALQYDQPRVIAGGVLVQF